MTTKEQAQKALERIDREIKALFPDYKPDSEFAEDINTIRAALQSHLTAQEDAVLIKRSLVHDLCDEGTDIKDPFVQGLYAAVVDRLIDKGLIHGATAPKQDYQEVIETHDKIQARCAGLERENESLRHIAEKLAVALKLYADGRVIYMNGYFYEYAEENIDLTSYKKFGEKAKQALAEYEKTKGDMR